MSDDLAELMDRYCDGDGAAFSALYRKAAPQVLGYLIGLAGDRATAEDVLQVTFLKIHKARDRYVRGARPLPWIYAIAHRTFIDEARRRQRARVRVRPTADHPEPDMPAHITGERLVDAASRVDNSELIGHVLEGLKELPPAQREAVSLTKLQGKSMAEAAEIAGTSIGAMKVRAHRGYVALRKYVQEQELEE